jgi:hypothetical protein
MSRTRTPEQIIGKDRLLQLIFEGYVVVPAEPTPAMMAAGRALIKDPPDGGRFDQAAAIYRAMIQAAVDV